MSDQPTKQQGVLYSIKELSELGGVSRRTIRYYVQRGLLPTPTGTGRGKHYTQRHLELLIEIRRRQEAGDSLSTIERTLSVGAMPRREVEGVGQRETWMHLRVHEDVTLLVRTPTRSGAPIDIARLEKLVAMSLEICQRPESPELDLSEESTDV